MRHVGRYTHEDDAVCVEFSVGFDAVPFVAATRWEPAEGGYLDDFQGEPTEITRYGEDGDVLEGPRPLTAPERAEWMAWFGKRLGDKAWATALADSLIDQLDAADEAARNHADDARFEEYRERLSA